MFDVPLVVPVAFFIGTGFLSVFIVRAAHFLFAKLLTCHPTKRHLLISEDFDKEEVENLEYEGFVRKVAKLFVANFVVVASILLAVYIYTSSPIGGDLADSIDVWFTILFISIIFIFSLRVGSLADMSLETPFNKGMRQRSVGFGYGFILTTYFLTMIGFGAVVIQTDGSIGVDIGASTTEVAWFTILFILGPFVSALFSEILLDPQVLDVRDVDGYGDEDLQSLDD
jgi:hypothetical protein